MFPSDDKDKLYELLHKKMTGELLLPERLKLSELLKDPQNEAVSKIFEDLFLQERTFNSHDYIDSETKVKTRLFAQIQRTTLPQKEISKSFILQRYFKYVAVAAILLLVAGFFIFFLNDRYSNDEGRPDKIVSASTNKGSKTSLVLPDGTKVWVNSDTKLTYDENFGKAERPVNLEGEAYFDVVKDPSRPFFVRTKYITVRVVGTTFNVKAYPESNYTETTLINGSVEVTLKRDSLKKIILSPNEKLSLDNEYHSGAQKNSHVSGSASKNILITDIVKPANDSLAVEVQWTKNRLGFYDMKLEDVARELSRWYNVEVHINGEQLKNKKYSGLFEGESITEVIEALQLTGGFHYKIDKNTIIIFP